MAVTNFLQLPQYLNKSTLRGTTARAKFIATTDGAIDTTTSVVPDPAFTCTKDTNTAGKYDLVFPPCIDVDLSFSVYSPAGTVASVIVTALDAKAGTASILCAGLASAGTLSNLAVTGTLTSTAVTGPTAQTTLTGAVSGSDVVVPAAGLAGTVTSGAVTGTVTSGTVAVTSAAAYLASGDALVIRYDATTEV